MSTAGTGLYDSRSTAMGKDDFLTLLLTQLQNQDPLNPTDSTEYTAQLAQFSSLEQLSNINDNLEYLHLFQASINNAQAVTFIGKEVMALGNEIQVNETIEQGAMDAGRQTVIWDGTDQNGNPVADGNYTFEVMAVDDKSQDIAAITYTSGTVSGVTFLEGITYFLVGNQKISIADIVEVVQPESEES
jgi:flagellar basal-body rod modification protein FlgD